jgi:Tol biopolymer transport system component
MLLIVFLSFSCSINAGQYQELEHASAASLSIETISKEESQISIDLEEGFTGDKEDIDRIPKDATLIDFLSADYTSNNVILVSHSGKILRKITDDEHKNYGPRLSPDRQKIVYFSDAYGVYDIYVLDASRNSLKNITKNNAQDYSPNWSPCGKKISYVSDEAGYNDIYIIDADGSNKKQLVNNGGNNYNPIWSKDGERILYISDEEEILNIYSITTDGTDKQKLTDDDYFAQDICLSPDGSQVVYVAYEMVSTVLEVFLLQLPTLEIEIMTETMCYTTMPLWALGGTRIIFNSIMDDYLDIYIIDPDGSNMEKLTDNNKDNHLLTISDDGRFIFFQTFEVDDAFRLYMYDLENGQTIDIAL